MGFCFVHAADLHLDTPYEGVGTASPAVAEALREASLGAFDEVVQLTLEREAAFLLIAGDIYDGAERGVRAQLRFLSGLRRLSAADVPVFIVHGNHDPLGGWPGVREWPPGVHVFGASEAEVVSVERDGSVVAHVHGISYGQRDVSEDLSARLRPTAARGLNIALLHCNVGGDPTHAPYSPCSLDGLVAAGFDYWALGHIHLHQVLHEGTPWVVYAGGTQGRSLKPSERGEKGVCVVHVEGGAVRRVEPVPVDRVRFATVEVDVGDLDDLGVLRTRLQAEAEALRASAGTRGVVVRALLRGRGPVHGDLGCAGGVEGLIADLRAEFEGEQPFLWWESLRDHTQPALDLEVIRGRDDFSSAVVQRVDALTGTKAGPAGFVSERILAGAPRKAARLLEESPEAEARALIDDARALALGLLEEESDACT
ncbi:MAG: metallophosphoesterase family protein [Thermoleophilia bacterium]